MLALHPEFLTKEGHKLFAVLPYEEFCQIQEVFADFEDLAALRRAKAEEATASTSSLEQVEKLTRRIYRLRLPPFSPPNRVTFKTAILNTKAGFPQCLIKNYGLISI
jgi:hypothetical protein